MLPALPPALAPTMAVQPDQVNAFAIYGASPQVILGSPVPDEFGCMNWWHDIDGWFATTPVDAAIQGLGNSDYSAWNTRFYRNARALTITGTFACPSVDAAMAARQRLAQWWGDPNLIFDMIVYEPVPKKITVRSSDKLDMPWANSVGNAKGFTFSIPLIAEDPIKYGLVQKTAACGVQTPGAYSRTYPSTWPRTYGGGSVSAGRLTIVNDGTVDTPPTSIVTGPVPSGWRITNADTGEWLQVGAGLARGQQLTIDHRTQVATVDGRDVTVLMSGTFFTLPVGVSHVAFTADAADPDAGLQMIAFDAYR